MPSTAKKLRQRKRIKKLKAMKNKGISVIPRMLRVLRNNRVILNKQNAKKNV